MRTLDALTGSLRYEFHYTDNLLTSIEDGYGNVTSIQRDANTNSIRIVSQAVDVTTLQLNANQFATSITNPADHTIKLTYKDNGLMETFIDANNNPPHTFDYEPITGRLLKDADPVGGSLSLSRVDTPTSYTVTKTSGLGQITTYVHEDLPEGGHRRTTIHPTGAITEVITSMDGSKKITYPDGTVAEYTVSPDPRWGMQSPLVSSLIITPPLGSPPCIMSASRNVVLSNPEDPFSLKSITDTLEINDVPYVSSFDAETKEIVTTSPTGLKGTIVLDSHGRIWKKQFGGNTIDPLILTRNGDGRIHKVQQGIYYWLYDYVDKMVTRTNAAGDSIQILYDAAGKPNEITLPSTRKYHFQFDSNNNFKGVTMPKLDCVHNLDYSAINLRTKYITPIPFGSSYVRDYDIDRKTDLITLPTGRTQDFQYDVTERLSKIIYNEGEIEIGYETPQSKRINSINHKPTNGIGGSQVLIFGFDGFLIKSMEWNGLINGKLLFTYNNDFMVENMKLTAGNDVSDLTLDYDDDGQLVKFGDFIYIRDGPGGNPISIDDGVFKLEFGYDSSGRIAHRTFKINGQILYQSDLTFNNIGQILTKTEMIENITANYGYTYDADGRLTVVTQDGSIKEHYWHDANGNRENRQIDGGALETTVYDNEDRIINTNNGAKIYQYDTDGNLINRNGDILEHNALGELVQATTVGGKTITYSYDGLRRRVSRTDDSGTYQFFYGNTDSHTQITGIRDPNGIFTLYHYDEGGRLFAMDRGNDRFYIATDHLRYAQDSFECFRYHRENHQI